MQKVENQIKNLVINSIDNSAIISSSFFGGGGKESRIKLQFTHLL